MRGKIGVCLLAAVAFSFLAVPSAPADTNVAGWWRVQVKITEGDFVTGEWTRIQTPSSRYLSYMFIALTSSSSGTAYFVAWDNNTKVYFLENTYTLYTKNNIVLLTGPATSDDEFQLNSSSTIVLKAYGGAGLSIMTGNYTRYDRDGEQFVGMGTLTATRANLLNTIPDEVKLLIP
jgi:hypothetical protein